ncbi:uncharacterized protein LOC131850489 [Achroia grisella]|uniref:uncharacterized protein LOC131850489 n=1 Tax=Achroia grisella TaxID=688607 RepID=UPI0027D2C22D|nr:uncharacterized protein LOC131850489 [Achroia grisella]
MRVYMLLCALILGCARADSDDVQYVKSVKGGFGGRYQYKGDANYLRFYNNTQVNTTRHDPSENVGVCYIEVPTVNLVSDPSHVPAGNGSRPELSRIRTCCKGYIRNAHNYMLCEPFCSNDCINALCVGPETCKCFPDHVKNLAGVCVATCPIGCQNGHCAGGECICKDGFKLDTDSKFCIPSCKENCGGLGNCIAPNTCDCKTGYKSTRDGSCQASCERCENGDCVAPNECRCHFGYTKDQHGQCVPQCNPSCGSGSSCVAPNACSRPSNSDDGTHLQVTPIRYRPSYPQNQIQNGSAPYPYNQTDYHQYSQNQGQSQSDYGRGDIESYNSRYPTNQGGDQYSIHQRHNINNTVQESSSDSQYYSTHYGIYNPQNPSHGPNSFSLHAISNNSDSQGFNGTNNLQHSSNQYPNNPNSNNQYPNNQYPNNQYPNNQYPNNQYSNNQYPSNQYPNNQYPNNQYPNNQYPNGQYPNNQYPNSQNPNNTNTNQQRHTYPPSSPRYGPNYDSNQDTTTEQYPQNSPGRHNPNDRTQHPNNPLYPNQGSDNPQYSGGSQPNYRPSQGGPYQGRNPGYVINIDEAYGIPNPTGDHNRPLNTYNQVGQDQTQSRNSSQDINQGSYSDYEQNQQTAEFLPVCSQPCINSHCVEGNECRCNPGYIPDRSNPNRCLPNCPGGCPNGICSAPHLCLCNVGYYKDTSVKGRQVCIKR